MCIDIKLEQVRLVKRNFSKSKKTSIVTVVYTVVYSEVWNTALIIVSSSQHQMNGCYKIKL